MKRYYIRERQGERGLYELVRTIDEAIIYCQTMEAVEEYAMQYETEHNCGIGELVQY
jgi:hypothetical protein